MSLGIMLFPLMENLLSGSYSHSFGPIGFEFTLSSSMYLSGKILCGSLPKNDSPCPQSLVDDSTPATTKPDQALWHYEDNT